MPKNTSSLPKGLISITTPPAHLAYAAFKDDDGTAVVHKVSFFGLLPANMTGGAPQIVGLLIGDDASACEDSDNFIGYAATKEAAADLLKAETT